MSSLALVIFFSLYYPLMAKVLDTKWAFDLIGEEYCLQIFFVCFMLLPGLCVFYGRSPPQQSTKSKSRAASHLNANSHGKLAAAEQAEIEETVNYVRKVGEVLQVYEQDLYALSEALTARAAILRRSIVGDGSSETEAQRQHAPEESQNPDRVQRRCLPVIPNTDDQVSQMTVERQKDDIQGTSAVEQLFDEVETLWTDALPSHQAVHTAQEELVYGCRTYFDEKGEALTEVEFTDLELQILGLCEVDVSKYPRVSDFGASRGEPSPRPS